VILVVSKRVHIDVDISVYPADGDQTLFSIRFAAIFAGDRGKKVEALDDRKVHAMFGEVASALAFRPTSS
jgi:hypothetical protein